jgi:hypothetical protein
MELGQSISIEGHMSGLFATGPFFDPLVTIVPWALIGPTFGGVSCPKSVTHVSRHFCYPRPRPYPK